MHLHQTQMEVLQKIDVLGAESLLSRSNLHTNLRNYIEACRNSMANEDSRAHVFTDSTLSLIEKCNEPAFPDDVLTLVVYILQIQGGVRSQKYVVLLDDFYDFVYTGGPKICELVFLYWAVGKISIEKYGSNKYAYFPGQRYVMLKHMVGDWILK